MATTRKKATKKRAATKTETAESGAPEPTNISRLAQTTLMDNLKFSAETLQRDAMEQPQLFFAACEYRVEKMHTRAEAAVRYKTVRAETEFAIRRTAAAAGERITEGTVSNRLECDSELGELYRKLMAAEEAEEIAIRLMDAFRMRRDMLRVVADLTRTELSSEAYGRAAAEASEAVMERARSKYPRRSQ